MLHPTTAGVEVDVRVIPRAKKSQLAGQRGGALLVRLNAPPVEGAANDALIDLFADILHVSRRSVVIVSGGRARRKRVAVSGVTVREAAKAFGLA